MSNNLVLETKLYNLSTRGSGGNILNDDANYKSHIEYNIPDMIVPRINIIFSNIIFLNHYLWKHKDYVKKNFLIG